MNKITIDEREILRVAGEVEALREHAGKILSELDSLLPREKKKPMPRLKLSTGKTLQPKPRRVL